MSGGSEALDPKNYTYSHLVKQNRTPAGQSALPKPVPELIYATGSKTFYLLSPAETAIFQSSVQWFQAPISKVTTANAQTPDSTTRSQQIANTKVALNQILKPYVQGAGSNTIAEVIWIGQKRFVYLDQKKLQQFKTYYQAQDEAAQQEIQNADGSFSAAKLLPKLQVQDTDLASWSSNYEGGLADISIPLNNPNSPFVATEDAQLLRYTAGLSTSAGYEPDAKAFSLDANAQAQLTLASATVTVTSKVPEQGYNATFQLPTKSGGTQPLNLGLFQAEFDLTLSEFVGASVLACVNMNCGMSQSGQLQIKGDNNPPPTANNPTVAGGNVNAFAGAQAGCEVKCSLNWQNPEKSLDWDEMAWIDSSGDVSAGAGVNGDFCISYNTETGKFLVHGSAGLTLGPGLDGSFTLVVDAKNVLSFVQFVYHKILNSNFSYTGVMEDLAFKVFVNLITKYIFAPEIAIGNFFLQEAQQIVSWWSSVETMFQIGDPQVQQVLNIANNINASPNNDGLKFSIPEVKGRLLYILTDPALPQALYNNALEQISAWNNAGSGMAPPGAGMASPAQAQAQADQDLQTIETAILNILSYVQSAHDYDNVVTHMSLNPMEKIPATVGEQRLYNSLNSATYQLPRLQNLHLQLHNGEVIYAPWPTKNQPVKPNATVIGIRNGS